MPEKQPHRKRIKHYDEPGDFHELTFSCYHRWKLLTNNAWRVFLARAIDNAFIAEDCRLAAFVFMPEHVHLLMYPADGSVDPERISRLLAAVKRPCSAQIKERLLETGSPLLDRLTVLERPGKTAFRFWQEGPGYDRNLQTEDAVCSSIDYIHTNPVRRQLCSTTSHWRWSSALWYLSDAAAVDPILPKIHGLPSGLFVK
ncbi:MAG: transposase [Thermoguttaceae bacterium]